MKQKTCSKCNGRKSVSNFSIRKASPDGFDAWCKECRHSYYVSRRTLKTRKREENQCRKCWRTFDHDVPTYCLDCRRALGSARNLSKYGLTTDDYIQMELDRNGLCDICKKPEPYRKRLSVDHDHSCCPGSESCGKCIRGLLCTRCNQALGMFDDSVDRLKRAIAYLLPVHHRSGYLSKLDIIRATNK